MDTLYLKRNRLGKDDRGDVESLRGLLKRPTITCLDISDNYLSDPQILDEILVKMPNLAVLYCQGNDFIKNISHYRKTLIAKIPTLKYLDDRPVFEEDRRRAEAFAKGGLEEERAEIRRLKKEKEDKHWANHEAFMLMINKAKQEKKEKEEAEQANKENKKQSMKEMMANAKAEKEAKLAERSEGKHEYSEQELQESNQYFKEMSEKSEQRFEEKQANRDHAEPAVDVQLGDSEFGQQAAQKYH